MGLSYLKLIHLGNWKEISIHSKRKKEESSICAPASMQLWTNDQL